MEDALSRVFWIDLPQPGPRTEMIYFCDGEGSVSTGLGEKVLLFPGNIPVPSLPVYMLWVVFKLADSLRVTGSWWCHIRLTAGGEHGPPRAAPMGIVGCFKIPRGPWLLMLTDHVDRSAQRRPTTESVYRMWGEIGRPCKGLPLRGQGSFRLTSF